MRSPKQLLAEACRYTALHSSVAPLIRRLSSECMQEKLAMGPHVGYWPKIKSPRTFNEHIVNRKLFTNCDKYVTFSDKYAVRSYVKGRIDSDILNELYYVGDHPDEIPFEELPGEFVLKATHGSGFNKIIDEKSAVDYDELRELCHTWLTTLYGSNTNEYWYEKMDPKIIIEKRLRDDKHGVPLDYKFHVFNGTAEYIQVDIDRFGNHSRRIYDIDWEPAGFTLKYPKGPEVPKPEKLDRMKLIAEKLAAEHDYLRVDLYQPNGEEVIFGEITVAPGAGHERFTPKEWDFRLGELWG